MCDDHIVVAFGCPIHIPFETIFFCDHQPITTTMQRAPRVYAAAGTYMYMLIIFFQIINEIHYPRRLSFRLVLL